MSGVKLYCQNEYYNKILGIIVYSVKLILLCTIPSKNVNCSNWDIFTSACLNLAHCVALMHNCNVQYGTVLVYHSSLHWGVTCNCSLNSIHQALCLVNCVLCMVHWALSTVNCSLCTVYCELCTVHLHYSVYLVRSVNSAQWKIKWELEWLCEQKSTMTCDWHNRMRSWLEAFHNSQFRMII